MLGLKGELRWIFRCHVCGHPVQARSFEYESPCPVCGGTLERLGRIIVFLDGEEVKEDANGA